MGFCAAGNKKPIDMDFFNNLGLTASSIVMGEPAYEPSQDYSTNVELQDAFDVMCQGGNYAIIGNINRAWKN